MTVQIRKLQPQDVSSYREIRLACLKNAPDSFGTMYEEEVKIPKLKFETFIESEAQDHFMFGAFDDEKLIGIMGFERMDRQRARHRGEVVQVYVEPSYRGQNVGEQLLRSVLEYAFTLDGVEQAQLSAIAGNQSAIRLYEKVGFKIYGVQLKYFKIGDEYKDQLFMQLFKSDYF